jgi:hypothetical protein
MRNYNFPPRLPPSENACESVSAVLRMDNDNDTFPRGLAYHRAHVCLGGEGRGAAQARLQGPGTPGSTPGQMFQTQKVQVKPSVSTEQSPNPRADL